MNKGQLKLSLCELAYLVLPVWFLMICYVRGENLPFSPKWLGPIGGDVRSIALDPNNPLILYAGTDEGVLFKSQDGAQSWIRLNTGMEKEEMVIQRILVDRRYPGNVWVIAWMLRSSGGVVLRTKNAGNSWEEVFSRPEEAGVRDLILPTHSDNRIYLTSLQGIYKSDDEGQHWDYLPETGQLDHGVKTSWVHPHDSSLILAGTRRLIFRTVDGGINWELFSKGIRLDSDIFRIISLDTEGQQILVSACSGIYRSMDGGQNWRQGILHSKVPGQWMGKRVLSLGTSKDGMTIYAGTSTGLYRSIDAGLSWIFCYGENLIVHDLAVDPADKDTVYLATEDEGILKSTNAGESFQSCNQGLIHHRISAIAANLWNPKEILVGMPDDYREGGVYRTVDGGLNWEKDELSSGQPSDEVYALLKLTVPRDCYLAGTADGLYMKAENEERWQIVAPAQVHGRINALAFLPNSYSGAIVAAGQEGLFLSENGETWRQALSGNGGDKKEAIYSLAVCSKSNYCLLAGGLGCIWISEDMGHTWRAMKNGLPEVPIQSLLCPFEGKGTWILGTRLGIFRSMDQGANWGKVSDNLGGVDATVLTFFPIKDFKKTGALTADIQCLLATDAYSGGLVYSTDTGVTWHRYPGWKIPLCSLWIKPDPQGLFLGGTASDGLFSIGLRDFLAPILF